MVALALMGAPPAAAPSESDDAVLGNTAPPAVPPSIPPAGIVALMPETEAPVSAPGAPPPLASALAHKVCLVLGLK